MVMKIVYLLPNQAGRWIVRLELWMKKKHAITMVLTEYVYYDKMEISLLLSLCFFPYCYIEHSAKTYDYILGTGVTFSIPIFKQLLCHATICINLLIGLSLLTYFIRWKIYWAFKSMSTYEPTSSVGRHSSHASLVTQQKS